MSPPPPDPPPFTLPPDTSRQVMDPTFGFSVGCAEMHGYPHSEWRAGEFRAVRQLKCAWGDRMTLLAELNSPQGRLYPYPDGPWIMGSEGQIFPLATSVSAKCAPLKAEQRKDTELQLATGHPVAEYDYALITVGYSVLGPVSYSNGWRITERLGPSTAYESVPVDKLHWEDGDGPLLKDPIPRIMSGLDYVLTIDGMTAAPSDTYTFVGQVNMNQVVSYTLDLPFEPGTLLYRAPIVVASSAWGENDKWKVIWRFSWKPWGWNNFYRPDGDPPGFYPVYLPSGTRYYQYPVSTVTTF